ADARPLIVADVRRSALFNEQDGPAAIFEDGRLVAGGAVRVHALITNLPVYSHAHFNFGQHVTGAGRDWHLPVRLPRLPDGNHGIRSPRKNEPARIKIG